jgi:uncharacterized protein YcfL
MKKFIFLSIIALVTITGCASNASNVAYVDSVKIKNQNLNQNITILDRKKRLNNGLVEVYVVLSNNTDKAQNIQYRFIWMDEDGFIVYKEPWQRKYINPKDTIKISSIATDKRVTDFKFEFKEEK